MVAASTAVDLIQQRLGIAATSHLRTDVERLLAELSNGKISELVERLRITRDDNPEWQAIIQQLAIGETYFFRDRRQFDLIRGQLLPQLIEARRQQNHYTLNLWSAGCATGEELYSLAILVYELLGTDQARWSLRLIGTDLNATALEHARRGVYRPWSFRQTDASIRRYFDTVDTGLRVKPFLREMVQFRMANILGTPPLPQCDLVLCRNMLLYFHDRQAEAVETRLREIVAPDGWLMLGPAEAMHTRSGWSLHLFGGVSVYRPANRQGIELIHESPDRMPPPSRPGNAPDPTVEQDYEAAVLARQRDDHAEAQHLLKQILRVDSKHARAYLLMAALAADQNRIEEAHQHLDAALQAEPLLADAYYLRGLLYNAHNRGTEAETAYRDALYCQRNHPLAAMMLGTISARAGDVPRALRLWRSAQRAIHDLKPDSPLNDISDLTVGQFRAMLDQQLKA